ncbi:hypothetical protein MTZ49_01585 [Entomomonas sp. E2T0]|uniref:hypothetical protein n=1 Tax=Entomomonas sp. E2T0 TaxID=2930213 RepID=UPI0022284DFA|nr:hypothetical protein [Entomomonas sp. E2T0]UYZ84299.1 hypothetical protein MTZ49_01585 [Entomomonas sp. E2T0]
MSYLARPIMAVFGLVPALVGIYYIGYTKGQQQAENTHNALQLSELRAIIAQSKNLTQQAQKASSEIEKVIAQAKEANYKTTVEFEHDLEATKNARASCVFDDVIMQQLKAARSRAAAAAIATDTSSLDGVLRPTSNDNPQHRR